MKFKEWLALSETGTSTGDVAAFSRIAIPLVRRAWSPEIEDLVIDGKKPKKRKLYQVPQVSA